MNGRARAIVLFIGGLAVVAGCGGNGTGGGADSMMGGQPDMLVADTCPRNGVVPADLRDVERAGEGLVSTTFGEYPARMASWDRAAIVLTVLEQVWGRSKTACPGLPMASSAQLDAAIATLEKSIPAKDQKASVYAANAVGLAVVEIFDYFKPDAPKEIIRMDAVFRQLGIDAHFGDLAASQKDAMSLRTDYNNAKKAIDARVPMCHRVGGTAMVESEVEMSLANADAAFLKKDAAVVETESDNGALEVDILELLFDCPPDGTMPVKGLGAKCKVDKDCDPGQVCDTTNHGGVCAPDPSNKIGTACKSTVDCGSDGRAACQTEAGDRYPGGYCFMEPCDDIQVCPASGTCVSLGGETPGCFKRCTGDADCRTAEGYLCQLFVTVPPVGFGPTDHACAFPCTRDADCSHNGDGTIALKCPTPYDKTKPNSGKCTP